MVERLRYVPLVNQLEPGKIETVTNIMMLSPRSWNDFRALEELLVSYTRVSRRALCHVTITAEHSYTENRGMYPYNLGAIM